MPKEDLKLGRNLIHTVIITEQGQGNLDLILEKCYLILKFNAKYLIFTASK